MRAFATFGIKQALVYLNDADVRVIEIPLKQRYAPAELLLEAQVQAQEQLQYDEDYDVLAFACVQDSEADFSSSKRSKQHQNDNMPEPERLDSPLNSGYLRLAVASKTAIEQSQTRKKEQVWYTRAGQRYCFKPSWHALQQQKRRIFWSMCLLCLSAPILLAMTWGHFESAQLQSRKMAQLLLEQKQEKARILSTQRQTQHSQVQKAKNAWAELLESIHTLEQYMPKNASVQSLDWQKQKLQVKGFFPASQAKKASRALSGLLTETSFVLQSEGKSMQGEAPVRFQLARTW